MARTLSICGWEQFQHYKDRDPPWIKLYRDVLTTESWVLGTNLTRLVQIASTLLAARYKNKIPLHHGLFCRVASIDVTAHELDGAISHLIAYKFMEIQGDEDAPELIASNMLATCTSEQSRAEQRESRVEQSRADPSASATPTRKRNRQGIIPLTLDQAGDPAWLVEFRACYPQRAGDQGWRKAIRAANARIAEGHLPGEFIAGALRYAEYLRAGDKLGTEYVKQAATFLGPDKPFLQPWTPAPSRAERRFESNADIARQFAGEHREAS